jgi:thiol-disulfide isomerase/thioredoxin
MKTPKNLLFRAVRIVVITAAAFAVIVYVHLRRQARSLELEPSARVVELAAGADVAPLLGGSPVVLLSFGADWCGNCKAMKPHLHRLADAHPNALSVVLVDVDAHPKLAADNGVKAVPDTRLYVGGKAVEGRKGYQTREALDEWLRPHIVAAAYSHSHDHGHNHGHGHGQHGQHGQHGHIGHEH